MAKSIKKKKGGTSEAVAEPNTRVLLHGKTFTRSIEQVREINQKLLKLKS